jgi:hypothetical protein
VYPNVQPLFRLPPGPLLHAVALGAADTLAALAVLLDVRDLSQRRTALALGAVGQLRQLDRPLRSQREKWEAPPATEAAADASTTGSYEATVATRPADWVRLAEATTRVTATHEAAAAAAAANEVVNGRGEEVHRGRGQKVLR